MKSLLRKEVDKGLTELSKSIGLKKQKYNFYKNIDENTYATLGFGLATHVIQGHILVSVFVGISNVILEELNSKLSEYENKYVNSSINFNIGYLMPENNYKEWDFHENVDKNLLFEDILQKIKIYGYPYYERMKDFNNFFDAINNRETGVLHVTRDKYLPILYYLKGDKVRALLAIEEAIERQNKPIDDSRILKFPGTKEIITIIGSGIGKVSPEYLKFAENLKKILI